MVSPLVPTTDLCSFSGPQHFWHQGRFHARQFFRGPGYGLGMIQEHHIYYALYFYYYYISSSSDLQVLDPRGWEPLVYRAQA